MLPKNSPSRFLSIIGTIQVPASASAWCVDFSLATYPNSDGKPVLVESVLNKPVFAP
jgi:hypothetical protein